MLKKITAISTLCFSLCMANVQAGPHDFNAYSNTPSQANGLRSQDPSSPAATAQRDAIMEENEEDSTDTYAIPLDSSEVELQEELNRLERKGGQPR